MKYLALILLLATPAYAVSSKPDNSPLFYCKELHNYNGLNDTTTKDFMLFAACIDEIRNDMIRQKQTDLWEFLKKNPRYRFAGQSWNKCFNRPKERALAKFETKADGSTMAYYKDKVRECY